jgi:hypothetical protein
MRQKIIGAYSDRKTGTHFSGIRAGPVAKTGETDSGVAMFCAALSASRRHQIKSGRGDVSGVSAFQEQ